MNRIRRIKCPLCNSGLHLGADGQIVTNGLDIEMVLRDTAATMRVKRDGTVLIEWSHQCHVNTDQVP